MPAKPRLGLPTKLGSLASPSAATTLAAKAFDFSSWICVWSSSPESFCEPCETIVTVAFSSSGGWLVLMSTVELAVYRGVVSMSCRMVSVRKAAKYREHQPQVLAYRSPVLLKIVLDIALRILGQNRELRLARLPVSADGVW